MPRQTERDSESVSYDPHMIDPVLKTKAMSLSAPDRLELIGTL